MWLVGQGLLPYCHFELEDIDASKIERPIMPGACPKDGAPPADALTPAPGAAGAQAPAVAGPPPGKPKGKPAAASPPPKKGGKAEAGAKGAAGGKKGKGGKGGKVAMAEAASAVQVGVSVWLLEIYQILYQISSYIIDSFVMYAYFFPA